MNIPSLILLNGPPRSGKDFAGSLLHRMVEAAGRPAGVVKFARVVKEGCHRAYELLNEDGEPLRHDHFEQRKDVPLPEFLGRTPRECYIAYSEKFLKPLHGEDVFGRLLLEKLGGDPSLGTVIVTDSGFAAEARPVVEFVGASRALLIRLHREGCTFAGDSRTYIELPGVRTVDLVNPGEPEAFARLLRGALEGH